MKRLLVLGAFVAASLFFFGGHQGTAKAQPGNYGDAGCGLGSILFGAKPGFVQVFASTTNGTSRLSDRNRRGSDPGETEGRGAGGSRFPGLARGRSGTAGRPRTR